MSVGWHSDDESLFQGMLGFSKDSQGSCKFCRVVGHSFEGFCMLEDLVAEETSCKSVSFPAVLKSVLFLGRENSANESRCSQPKF